MRQKLSPTLRTRPVVSHLAVLLAVSFVVAPLSAFGSTLRGRARPEKMGGQSLLRKGLVPVPAPTPVPSPSPYEIAPASGVQGKEYEVLVTSNQCLETPSRNPVKDLQLYAPGGSGIRLTDSKATECRLTAKLSIAPDAPVGIVKLQLIDKDRNPRVVVDFAVTGITAGPIPPGLNNQGQVDVMWSVVPDKITNHNFGRGVQKHFYCIEVVIGNDSGYDLQLSSVGFTLPALKGQYRIPNSGYRTVRGSLEAFGEVAPRKLVVSGLKMLGPILTGFLPFFHATNHLANFSNAINVISNPIEKGLENVWPDLLPTQLDRLADQTYRDDVSTKTIIPNNVQARILTFIPKRLVCPDQKTCPFPDPTVKLDAKNVQDVMRALGEIVIVGQQIVHVNRIRVVNTPFGTSIADRSISGKVTDICNIGVGGVTMALSGGSDFTSRETTTSPDGTYNFSNIPIGRIYTVTPNLENMTFHNESPGSETFTLNDTKTNLNFGAEPVVLTLTGNVTRSDAQPIAADEISVELTGTGLAQTKTAPVNAAGVYRFELPASNLNLLTATFQLTAISAKYTFDGAKTWKCDKRAGDFIATPKPTPSPSP